MRSGEFIVKYLFTIHNSPFTTAYSYGDSAGITPDFPFNDSPEADQPVSGRKCIGKKMMTPNLFVSSVSWRTGFAQRQGEKEGN